MKDNSIWNEILLALKGKVKDEDIDKWLKTVKIHELRGDVVTLYTSNRFYKSWIEDNYLKLIKNVLKNDLSIDADIEIVTEGLTKKSQAPLNCNYIEEDIFNDAFGLPLDKQLTFDTFVAGDSNSFAHSACIAVSKGIKNMYNPLFIYGDVGLGKTHLMQAVGNELRLNFPKLKILYTTGENFVNEYVQVMRKQGAVEEFKLKYRNIDVLLFDDVQAIAGKTKSMEEFFFTFSQLHATQKQIILTSNMAPNEIPSLDRRLSSRFSSGLMVDVQSPSVEEKEAIIRKRIQMMGAEISNEVIRFLAENIKTDSVRELIGNIIRLNTLAVLKNTDITIELAKEVLKHFLIARDKVLSPDDIVLLVSNYFQLKPIDLKSKKRSQSITYPRSIAMYLLREKSSLSLAEVGEIFGRDHTTVLHSVKKINELLEKDTELKGTIETLTNKMKISCN